MTLFSLLLLDLAAVSARAFQCFDQTIARQAGSAPETCANCHVMDSQYENWYHAPHERWTECVVCHLPHENVVVYYLEKGRQGAKDVYAFTTGNIPVAIRASEKTKGIIQDNCIRCHASKVENIVMGAQPIDRYCWECHRNVSHGPRGASTVPFQDSTLYPVK